MTSHQAQAHVARALLQAADRLGTDDFHWEAWPQMWGDTSCGFGGISGQSMTEAQTMIAFLSRDTRVVVFHCGRYAYEVTHPSEEFWNLVTVRALPGKSEGGRAQLTKKT